MGVEKYRSLGDIESSHSKVEEKTWKSLHIPRNRLCWSSLSGVSQLKMTGRFSGHQVVSHRFKHEVDVEENVSDTENII